MRRNIIDRNELAILAAPIGTKEWAINKKRRIEERIDAAEDDIVNLDVEAVDFIDMKAWDLLADSNGVQFKTFRQFCEAPRPYGLGCVGRQFNILMSAYQRKKSGVQTIAANAKPLANAIRPGPGRGKKTLDNYQAFSADTPSIEGGTDPEYLTARIARDNPSVYGKMLSGAYRSVRAAAIDAGIIDPDKTKRYQLPTDPVAAARYLSSRVDERWIATFVAELIK